MNKTSFFITSLVLLIWIVNVHRYYNLRAPKVPIFYADEFNIRLFGLHKFHVFDSEKYYHIFEMLQLFGILSSNQFQEPPQLHNQTFNQELLELVHTREYLYDCLYDSNCIARVAEFGVLSHLPLSILQWKIISPMKTHVTSTVAATGAAINASKASDSFPFAISLSGGMHHAHAKMGGGWCFYNDIGISYKYWKCVKKEIRNALVIDLDAHQSNGIERDKYDNVLKCSNNDTSTLTIFDMYNADLYPHDSLAKKSINLKVELRSYTSDRLYLSLLRKALDKLSSNGVKYDVIFYNAGSDILEYVFLNQSYSNFIKYSGDPLGALRVSQQGVIARDDLVFHYAKKYFKAPLVMLLSGGYSKRSAPTVAYSIMQLLRKYFDQLVNIVLQKHL